MHRRVVGCVPVPNASPGSILRLIACESTGSHHDGTIHTLLLTRIGRNCACVLRTQSASASGRTECMGGRLCRSFPARNINADASVPAGSKAVSVQSGHKV